MVVQSDVPKDHRTFKLYASGCGCGCGCEFVVCDFGCLKSRVKLLYRILPSVRRITGPYTGEDGEGAVNT